MGNIITIFIVLCLLVVFKLVDKFDLTKKHFSIIGVLSLVTSIFYLYEKEVSNMVTILIPIVFFILIYISIVDLFYQEIPDFAIILLLILSFPLTLSLLNGRMTMNNVVILISENVVYLGFFILVYLLTKGSLGFGDVKLSLPIGVLLTKVFFLKFVGIAFILGGIYALYLLKFKERQEDEKIAFGPFMIIAFFILYL